MRPASRLGDLQAVRANIATVLHEGGRTGSGSRTTRVVRRALVVSQVGVAFVLLLGAALLVAAFRQILAIDPGFDPQPALTASVALPGARYPGGAERNRFTTEALRRIRALPDVEHVGASSVVPRDGNSSDSVVFAEGHQMQPGESVISPTQTSVAAGYFEALSIPLRRGRYFDDRHTSDAQLVVIVDERLAPKFWPGRDPVGLRMYQPNTPKSLAPDERTDSLTVVGVVGDVRQHGLVIERTPVGAYYYPMPQSQVRMMTFSVRTGSDPTAVSRCRSPPAPWPNGGSGWSRAGWTECSSTLVSGGGGRARNGVSRARAGRQRAGGAAHRTTPGSRPPGLARRSPACAASSLW